MKTRQDREVVLAKMRARSRRLREADVDAYRAKQRQRYQENRESIRQMNAASYVRHRAKRLAEMKAYREQDPHRADVSLAKRILIRTTGLRMRDIPDEIAAVKVLELQIKRELLAIQRGQDQ